MRADNPVGVVKGMIQADGSIANIDTGLIFGISGNSGSVLVQNIAGKNVVVGLLSAVDGKDIDTNDPPDTRPARGNGIFQPIKYVIDTSVNPEALDVRIYDKETNPVALFRYAEKDDSSANLLSSDWQEFGFGAATYRHTYNFLNKREGAIFRKERDYTNKVTMETYHFGQPFYRFYSQDKNDTIYTTSPEEGEMLKADGWCDAGKVGFLANQPVPGTIPLFRYFDGNHHVYTTTPSELDNTWAQQDPVYYVFSSDGEPDPSAYSGPPDAEISVAQLCSNIQLSIGDNKATTVASGTVRLTIEKGCTGPTCAMTIADMHLRASDFDINGTQITQLDLISDTQMLGTWKSDNTFVLPSGLVHVAVTFNQDGNPAAVTGTNFELPVQGTLNRDYSNFTMSGSFSQGTATLEFGLCGTTVEHPPQVVLAPPGPFECNSPSGAQVTFSAAQSSDPDNDIAHYSWQVDNQSSGSDAVTFPTVLSMGTHVVGVSVIDSRGASSTALETAKIADTTPPQLSVSLSQDCLWPPNHKYALFTLADDFNAQATDTCDAGPTVRIVNVESNQPPLGGGSGNTTQDFKFGSGAVCVRAERDGTLQTPREYTITLEATDHSGNKVSQPVVISVDHDQSGGSKCDIKSQRVVDDDDTRCTENIAGDTLLLKRSQIAQTIRAPRSSVPEMTVTSTLSGCSMSTSKPSSLFSLLALISSLMMLSCWQARRRPLRRNA